MRATTLRGGHSGPRDVKRTLCDALRRQAAGLDRSGREAAGLPRRSGLRVCVLRLCGVLGHLSASLVALEL